MSTPEERQCYHGEKFHLRNISFFAYWVQCKECGTYVCPRCSNLHNPKMSQFNFPFYLVISLFFYFGIVQFFTPIEEATPNLLFAYLFAGILMFIPFMVLLLRARSVTRQLLQQPEAITKCPRCDSSIFIIYHDIFLYFWLFFLHVLYIVLVMNEAGIYFFYVYKFNIPVNLFFVYLLIGLLIFIIWVFKRIGRQFMTGYKMNTRVWLGEIFCSFIYLMINTIFLLLIIPLFNLNPTNFYLGRFAESIIFSYNIFYYFTSVAFWYFPAFLIGSVIYKLSQRYLLNINKSKFIQFLIGILFIIGSFYIWGVISFHLGIYYAPNSDIIKTLPYYSTIFNEVIPLILFSLLLGIAITSLFRTYLSNSSKSQRNFYIKILIIFGISLFTGLILIENLYYLINESFFLDLFPSIIIPFLLVLIIGGGLVLLFYEIFSHWASPQTRWGKTLEKNLGSLIYPILIGFMLLALSLSPFIIILTSSSIIPTISGYRTDTNIFSLQLSDIFSLKLLFTIGFITGLIFALKKK